MYQLYSNFFPLKISDLQEPSSDIIVLYTAGLLYSQTRAWENLSIAFFRAIELWLFKKLCIYSLTIQRILFLVTFFTI